MGRQFLSFFRSVGPGDMAGVPLIRLGAVPCFARTRRICGVRVRRAIANKKPPP